MSDLPLRSDLDILMQRAVSESNKRLKRLAYIRKDFSAFIEPCDKTDSRLFEQLPASDTYVFGQILLEARDTGCNLRKLITKSILAYNQR